MFYFLNLYSYREYSRKKTNGFNSFNSLNSFNSKKLSECEKEQEIYSPAPCSLLPAPE